MSTKTLYAEVHPVQVEPFGDEPSGIRLDVTDEMAREIRHYASFVRNHKRVYNVEVFDSRAEWLDDIPEEPEPEPETYHPDYKVSECELDGITLNVGQDGFWYTAYIKHTDIEIRSEHWSLSDLPDEPVSKEGQDNDKTETFTVKCGWRMEGEYHIKAASREEAEDIVTNMPLPSDSRYIRKSFEIFSGNL